MLIRLKNVYVAFFILLIAFANGSCKKYLDKKSDKNLVVISSLQDMQALFDDYSNITYSDPGSGEISADNYYLTDGDWSGMNETYRRMYTWEKDFLFPASFNEWFNSYRQVYYANSVLENLGNVVKNSNNSTEWENIKGQAFFFRAEAFLQVATIWALAYDENTAATDLGIPLRLNSNFNEPSVRSSIKETYDRIISDLKESVNMLPIDQVQVTRPSKPAAYGLLARAYLSMRQYDSCRKYADLCLQLKNSLMDYNNPASPDFVNAASYPPFIQFNSEVLFESIIPNPAPLIDGTAKIDTNLYHSYSTDDLRKIAFFNDNGDGTYGFKGHYTLAQFGGIATDEIYLMRAECYARTGKITEAITDLNTLMVKRWSNAVPYPAFTATDANDALNKILLERRKELLMRGLRWMDIKRLNKEGANINLNRLINGQAYILSPNDLRFALPIPEDVISLSGMEQNPR